MALISVIRRWHYRDGLSIRGVARRTGLSRNTVRKYLHGDVLDPSYPKRSGTSKLDDYEEVLTTWLHREARRHRKQRKTIKQLHRDLVGIGFTGSYDRVAAFARLWRQQQRDQERQPGKAYVPLVFAPGEAFQFDWSEDWAYVGDRKVKLQIAHFKLSYSKAFYLRAYWTQTHEMLFDAHNQAFRFFGGVPERGIYDNMKTAVDRVGRGKHRVVNRRFQTMVSHYLFEAEFCNPAAGWEKGQVEKGVQDARRRLWSVAPRFADLNALNHWLEEQCRQLSQTLSHPQLKQSIAECWAAERAQLMPVPQPFDPYVEHTKRVSSTCLVTFERNAYSVPASFANRHVSLKVYPGNICCYAEDQLIATHPRVFTRDHNAPGVTTYDWRHYLTVAQRKPGALRNGAPFKDLPESFQQLQRLLLKRTGGDREMADVLALVLQYPEVQVEQAISQALQVGRPSKQHVMNCLSRLSAPEPPKPTATPHLKLVQEPQANTQRYDELRRHPHAH